MYADDLMHIQTRILSEHKVIRRVLRVVRDQLQDLDTIEPVLYEFRHRILAHMRDEETILPPYLAGGTGCDSPALAELCREHAEQREMLDALVHEPNRIHVEALLQRFELDMDREEMWLQSLADQVPDVRRFG